MESNEKRDFKDEVIDLMAKGIADAVGHGMREKCQMHAAAAMTTLLAAGYVVLPQRLTAENGAKGALSGEVQQLVEWPCPDCDIYSEEECESCGGEGMHDRYINIDWTTVKELHKRAVNLFYPEITL